MGTGIALCVQNPSQTLAVASVWVVTGVVIVARLVVVLVEAVCALVYVIGDVAIVQWVYPQVGAGVPVAVVCTYGGGSVMG